MYMYFEIESLVPLNLYIISLWIFPPYFSSSPNNSKTTITYSCGRGQRRHLELSGGGNSISCHHSNLGERWHFDPNGQYSLISQLYWCKVSSTCLYRSPNVHALIICFVRLCSVAASTLSTCIYLRVF